MAGKLTATMVVDLKDKTGAGISTAIGNLDRLKRAERELELAQRGAHLSRKHRAQENLMIAQQQAAQERKAQMMMWAGRAATAGAVMVAGQAASFSAYADAERRINRIAITADKGFSTVGGTMRQLHKAADDAYMPIDKVTEGMEALVASGRSMEDSLAFLPSVAMTAQAAGAEVADIGKTADAMAGSLGIGAADMQRAFDILVAGGKAGKFELKDMAQYLPSLLPAFSALGYEGTEGLEKMVAMLQIVRNQSGTAEGAATNLANVFQKMETKETRTKFKEMGVDIAKALKDARKSGKDVLDVFLDMTQVALKGDLSRIPLLFGDREMQQGVRALIMQRDALRDMTRSLKNVDGSTLRDFDQIAEDSAAKVQRLKTLMEELAIQSGKTVAPTANKILDTVNQWLRDKNALEDAEAGQTIADKAQQEGEFRDRYKKLKPSASNQELKDAYREALIQQGNGEIKSVYEWLAQRDSMLSRGRKTLLPAEFPGGARNLNPFDLPVSDVPTPLRRPKAETEDERRRRHLREGEEETRAWTSRGTYDPDIVAAANKGGDGTTWWQRRMREVSQWQDRNRGGLSVDEYMSWLSGYHDDPNYPVGAAYQWQKEAFPASSTQAPVSALARIIMADARISRQAGLGGSTDTLPGKQADDFDIGRTVSIQGTPAVTLSGTPSVSLAGPVTIANMPQPNVTFNVTVNGAQDPHAVVQVMQQEYNSGMSGVQASTNGFGN
ncbi:phage tail tape measure protein [Rhizobium sp. FKY42]|uniref:phage tail tape measure protein n=1 Tax=Rhizobium sp. FKY42 TaxID=2562310 RepID=UPI0010C0ADF3|nr:phage tail tape measure protein [Rhizobium sp. FKY42]